MSSPATTAENTYSPAAEFTVRLPGAPPGAVCGPVGARIARHGDEYELWADCDRVYGQRLTVSCASLREALADAKHEYEHARWGRRWSCVSAVATPAGRLEVRWRDNLVKLSLPFDYLGYEKGVDALLRNVEVDASWAARMHCAPASLMAALDEADVAEKRRAEITERFKEAMQRHEESMPAMKLHDGFMKRYAERKRALPRAK